MKETVRITKDENGNKIAVAEQIQFGGKRRVTWENVEAYLKEEFSGKSYKISETDETIHIGSDFPDEFTNSVYTKKLMGTSAKAKANSVQVLPQMIEIATNKRHENNKKRKHNKDAKLGWYRYDSRFALPVFNDAKEIERYNIFAVTLLVRCAKDEKMYLYDITEIKKRRESFSNPKIVLSKRTRPLDRHYTIWKMPLSRGFSAFSSFFLYTRKSKTRGFLLY